MKKSEPEIELSTVTPANYDLAMELSVREDQKGFVSSIQKSLADAYVYSESVFRLAYNQNKPVGYLLLFPYEKAQQKYANVARLMIDQRYQGQGLGRRLLEEALNLVAAFSPKVDVVRISTDPKNAPALALYKSRGFIEQGLEEGEIALYLASSEI